ncbi:MAG: DNA repair exonuclease [Candidatus Zixiibacteriota bacterium]
MKICHVSDSHLGAGENHPRRGESGLTLRQEDIIDSFTRAVDAIIALRPDLCIHSGDLFHTVRPSNRIMALAGEQLYRLAEENSIPTVIISGNHDAPKQPHIGAALDVFEYIDNLHIAAGTQLKAFQIGQAKILALPHCLTAQSLKEQLVLCRPDPDFKYNILVLHGVVAGMPEFSMADLGEQEFPVELMERFDYVALGHYHNQTQVASRAWYAGSTDRLSQAERDVAKGFAEIHLEPFEVLFHAVRCRDMVSLDVIDASGMRGDQLAAIIQEKVSRLDSRDKIVRLKIEGVSEESLKTLPVGVISSLKQKSFSLDIAFEKEKSDDAAASFGRSAIGRLDEGFVKFLDTVDLKGFDKEWLRTEGLKYLSSED